MIKIIINADDFGLNPIVNEEIKNYLRLGAISSTTILANTDYIDTVKCVTQEFKDVSFGVHLNLTEGRSITKSSILTKYGVIDNNNNFTKVIHQFKEYPFDLKQAIYWEWKAQIELLLSNDVMPSHIDGHHHVHGIIPLANTLISVAHEYGIQSVRSRYRSPLIWKIKKAFMPTPISNPESIIEKYSQQEMASINNSTIQRVDIIGILKSINKEHEWRNKLLDAGLKTTDYFGQYSNIYNIINSGMSVPLDRSFELMCHPGHPKYESETEAIREKKLSRLLNYNLITYKVL